MCDLVLMNHACFALNSAEGDDRTMTRNVESWKRISMGRFATVGLRVLVIGCILPCLISCSTVSKAYRYTKTTVKLAVGAGKIVYKIGEFTFSVVMAPLDWPLTRGEIETIDGLPPKEAIKEGRVKDAPYVVNGKNYVPMSVEKAKNYRERGIASWYGYETRNKPGGHMTANGEAFDPNGLNAAHKYLPLPIHVKVTNLENGRSILLRVNDRGPFVEGRIIDLSAGAAKKLGFYEKGTERVLVETIPVEG
jgi:rare lipoprotein A